MANIMNMKDVKNHVHRSGFDLSARHCITSKVGEIVPAAVIETIPGDKFTINMNDFMRTEPFQQASFARLRHYVDAYFVPYRLLWDKFPAWIMQTKNQYYARSLTSAAGEFDSQPFITSKDVVDYLKTLSADSVDDGGLSRIQTSLKLLSYMGYGLFNEHKSVNNGANLSYRGNFNLSLNIFPLLAYQKIYQDFFRFSQWEEAAPWTYNLDYVMTGNDLHLNVSQSGLSDASNLFDMRYCNYDKDMFNGLLPDSQYGDEAIASPISGSLHGSLQIEFPYGGSSTLPNSNIGIDGGTSPLRLTQNNNTSLTTSNSATLRINQQDLSSVAGLSVLGIRFATALQKWKEITLTGSSDYKEQLLKHWNVSTSDYASDRCQYLGGCASNIDINEVVNQNLTGSNQADLAGKGILSQNGHIKFSTDEYGVIIVLSHVKPIIEWSANDVLHPYLTRHYATDYAIPEFDNLGMQPLYDTNLYEGTFDLSGQPISTPLGFAPRYFDYKTNYDTVNGKFLMQPGWTLNHQPPTLKFTGGKYMIDYSFFRVLPSVVNNLFAQNASGSWESDVFYHSLFLDIKSARNLSYDGLPY